jgi:UDP-N-acetylmuramoyl-tripeptide--D-alanyl-D-alanine ligase
MAQTSRWKQPFHQARRALAKLWLRFFPNLTIIGVTGSYGKTNTTRAITQVLSERFPTLQTDLNLDTVYNLPITILKLRPKHQALVLEYGVDHKNEMDYHLALVKPSIGVITGINPTHSDPELLGSLEGIIEEKSKLLRALPRQPAGWAILNWNDEKVRKMEGETKAKIIRYGTTPECEFWAKEIKVDFSGTNFTLCSQKEEIKIKTGLVGRHFVLNCLAAAVVGKIKGLSWEEIKRGLEKLKPLTGRLSIEKGPRKSILLDDHLRANPASTLAGLQTLVDLPTKGRRIAILGEMGELGDSAKKEHQRIGRELAKLKKIDCLISVGPLQKLTAQEAIKAGMGEKRVFWVENVKGAAEVLKKILRPGDLVYLKGSLLRHTERILLILKGEKVGCRVVSCHNYWQCQNCPYLHSGPSDLK